MELIVTNNMKTIVPVVDPETGAHLGTIEIKGDTIYLVKRKAKKPIKTYKIDEAFVLLLGNKASPKMTAGMKKEFRTDVDF